MHTGAVCSKMLTMGIVSYPKPNTNLYTNNVL